MPINYREKIENSRVYDVARVTPLEFQPNLSARIDNRVLLKREDMQPVFSFKLRGAYNKMANLSPDVLKRGVIAGARHKKILKKAKGYFNARRKVFRTAKQAVIKAGQYAYRGRREKKREYRALWITRINAAARLCGLSYSRLVDGMSKAGLAIDRKVLADLAVHDMPAFTAIAEKAKASLTP